MATATLQRWGLDRDAGARDGGRPGDLTVIADTLFGKGGRTGSEVGPKIFLVPVAISDLEEEVRIPLPAMGFAFAGNVISGQFTHAMASTCLQNLAGWVSSGKPDVEDVARFYATCAVRIYEERRRHFAGDGYGFDGIVFGFSERRGHPAVFHFAAGVAPDGSCVAPVTELELEEDIPFAVEVARRQRASGSRICGAVALRSIRSP
jgi:hypothetical protein